MAWVRFTKMASEGTSLLLNRSGLAHSTIIYETSGLHFAGSARAASCYICSTEWGQARRLHRGSGVDVIGTRVRSLGGTAAHIFLGPKGGQHYSRSRKCPGGRLSR